jgi:hypothetical protein
MQSNRKKMSQRYKPFASFNTQAPPRKKGTRQGGPSRKGLPEEPSEPAKTREEALQQASYFLLGCALRGEPQTLDGMIVALFLAPFQGKEE